MELQGNLVLHRTPTRPWIGLLAVIVPMIACVVGVILFVRTFVSPPTIAIPSALELAAAPESSVVNDEPVDDEPVVSKPQEAAAFVEPPLQLEPAEQPTGSLPMLASLAAAPPNFDNSRAVGFAADRMHQDPAALIASNTEPAGPVPVRGEAPAALDATAPHITVPMPRPRPGMAVASLHHQSTPVSKIPQAEEEIAPAYDRHAPQ